MLFFGIFSAQSNLNTYRKSTLYPTFKVVDKNKNFINIASDIKPVGPIYLENNTEKGLSEYVRRIFIAFITGADKLVRLDYYNDNPEYHKNYTYYTFLLTALAVGQHESRLIHVKKTQSIDSCPSKSQYVIEEFNRFMKLPTEALQSTYSPIFVKNCKENSYQLLYHRGDVGIMQFNLKTWKNFLNDPSTLFDTYRNINIGLEILYEGFEIIRNNLYSFNEMCSSNTFLENPFRGQKINGSYTRETKYYRLAITTWSSNYNQGKSLVSFKRLKTNERIRKKFCYFLNPNNSKVKRLKEALNSLIITGDSLFHQYLPENSLERKVLEEIVYNFRSIFTANVIEKEKNLYLKELLKMDISNNKNFILPDRFKYRPTHFLKKEEVPFYSEKREERVCGFIDNTQFNLGIKVLKYEKPWSIVELPLYNIFLNPAREALIVRRTNIRILPTTKNNEPLELHSPTLNSRFLLLGGQAELNGRKTSYYPILYKGQRAYVYKNNILIKEKPIRLDCELSEENTQFYIKHKALSYNFSDFIGQAYLKSSKSIRLRKGPSTADTIIFQTFNRKKSIRVVIFDKKDTQDIRFPFWYKVSNPFGNPGKHLWIWSGSLEKIQLMENMKD